LDVIAVAELGNIGTPYVAASDTVGMLGAGAVAAPSRMRHQTLTWTQLVRVRAWACVYYVVRSVRREKHILKKRKREIKMVRGGKRMWD
jgi:hypothetical protein